MWFKHFKVSVYPKIDHFSKKKNSVSLFQKDLIVIFHLKNIYMKKKKIDSKQSYKRK